MNRNIGLDLLKIIATLAVVFLHTLNRYSGYSNVILYSLSSFAVPVFFMINGYFILNKKEISFHYIITKVMNIVFVCLIWNSLRMIQRIVMGLGYYTPIQETINIFFRQSGFFFQFWFFGSLIIIYCLLPILYKLHQHKRINKCFIITMIMICLIIHLTDCYSSYQNGNPFFLEYVKQPLRLWTWVTYFYLGGVVKSNLQYIRQLSLFHLLLSLWTLTLINVFYQTKIGSLINYEWAECFYDNPMMILWCMSLFILFCNNYFCEINEKFSYYITFISQLTIGCFILHIVFIVNIRSIYQYNSSYLNILISFMIFVLCMIITFILKKIPIVKHIISI